MGYHPAAAAVRGIGVGIVAFCWFPAPVAAADVAVQIGAFCNAESASALTQAVLAKGYPARTVSVDDLYRVVVGPFASEAAGRAAADRLRQAGYEAFIRRDLTLRATPPTVGAPAAAPPVSLTPPAVQHAPQTVAPRGPETATSEPSPPTPTTAEAQAEVEEAVAQKTEPLVQATVKAAAAESVPSAETAPTRPTTAPGPDVNERPGRVVPRPAPRADDDKDVEPPAVVAEGRLPLDPATPIATLPTKTGDAARSDPETRIASTARPGKRDIRKLKIRVLENVGPVDAVGQLETRDPVVQVVDQNNRPVAGAVVAFQTPSVGPSGYSMGTGCSRCSQTRPVKRRGRVSSREQRSGNSRST